jgi:hypothetical protein
VHDRNSWDADRHCRYETSLTPIPSPGPAPREALFIPRSRPTRDGAGSRQAGLAFIIGSLTAARARRYYGSGSLTYSRRLAGRCSSVAASPLSPARTRTTCASQPTGGPYRRTPGHGTVIPTAQPAYLRDSAIARGSSRHRNPSSDESETVSSPVSPMEERRGRG